MRRFLFPLTLILLLSPTLQAQVAVFDVPGAAGTHPVSINNSGDVAGWFSAPDGSRRGFVREFDGSITIFDGIPTSINDAGAVTGYVIDEALSLPRVRFHCFLRDQKGNITLFDVPVVYDPQQPPNYGNFGAAINNQGDIAGYARDSDMSDTPVGFVREQQGELTVFQLPHGAIPTSINGRGAIAGHTNQYYFHAQGFVRDPKGNITLFEVPGANSTGPAAYAVSINNAGDVAGYFGSCVQSSPSVCKTHGFVRKWDGSITVIDATPNASSTENTSINEKGDVLGTFSDENGGHQFLRDHKGNITVFDVPDGFFAGDGMSINNRDDVTGVLYDLQTYAVHGFIRSAH